MPLHTSIKMDTPCEMINITEINPFISKCQIKVCYVGEKPNRNNSVITKETATKIAQSLPGSPIVGYFNDTTEDYEEHNKIIELTGGKLKFSDTTKPYGFVDLGAKVWFQKFNDAGVEREYLMTEGFLWTTAYPECKRILERGNNQSMELNEETMRAHWAKDENGNPTFFIINEALIEKLCILGEEFEPCFEGAQITRAEFSFEEGFKQQLFSMISDMKETLEKGGAIIMDTEKEVLVAEEEIQEEFAAKENEKETCPECGKPLDECECDKKKDEKEDKKDFAAEEELVEEFAKEETVEELCKECGETVALCKCKKKKYNLEEVEEYTALKKEFDDLTTAFSNLKATSDSLTQELNSLREFKKSAERKEKQKMIDSFYMLSDEDKKDVVENIDTYSLDDIEAKLSVICVRNKVNFNLDEDIDNNKVDDVLNFNLNSLELNDEPAWVVALRNAKN